MLRLRPGGVASTAAGAGGSGCEGARVAGLLPSVAAPQAMQRTAPTTLRKSQEGQMTARVLVNSAAMGVGHSQSSALIPQHSR